MGEELVTIAGYRLTDFLLFLYKTNGDARPPTFRVDVSDYAP